MSSSTFYNWKCSRTSPLTNSWKKCAVVGSFTKGKCVNGVEMVSQARIICSALRGYQLHPDWALPYHRPSYLALVAHPCGSRISLPSVPTAVFSFSLSTVAQTINLEVIPIPFFFFPSHPNPANPVGSNLKIHPQSDSFSPWIMTMFCTGLPASKSWKK